MKTSKIKNHGKGGDGITFCRNNSDGHIYGVARGRGRRAFAVALYGGRGRYVTQNKIY